MTNGKVVCYGEVLWDSLPKGLFLGGAPLNVAVNLKKLGITTSMISAVGNDKMGELALKAIQRKGLSTDLIQTNDYSTGVVDVEIDEKGLPEYRINQPSAWDYIAYSDELQKEVDSSEFVVFGSLIFRNKVSREVLKKLLSNYEGRAILDMNLREPFYNKVLIDEILQIADILKMNEEELAIISSNGEFLIQENAVEELQQKYDLEMVIVTKGQEGAAVFKKEQVFESPGRDITVEDTVGAGDAFLAAFISGILNNNEPQTVLDFANQIGALVASKNGATPELDTDLIPKTDQEKNGQP